MYVHFGLSRIVSSPTTRHSNNHAIKMHSTLQSQHESNESPLSQHVSMDKFCFLKALCIFITTTEHISHAEISIVASRQARSISTSLPSSIYTILLSNSHLSPFNMYSSTPFVSLHRLLSTSCLRACHCPDVGPIAFPSEPTFPSLSLNHTQLQPSIALLYTRLLFIDC